MKSKNIKKYYFWLILFIFIIVKLSILFTSNYINDDEECSKGNIAMALINGPIVPFQDYIYHHYEGGTLIVGALAVPFYLLFGINGISLKLVALSFSIILFVMFFHFMKSFFGNKQAIVGSLLFILAPMFFLTITLISDADHFESIIFEFAVMFIFLTIFLKNKHFFRNYVLLGLVAGFGLWFCYQMLFMLVTIFIFWLFFDKLFFTRKKFFVFLLFFIIGFSPWIFYNFSHNFAGLERLHDGIGESFNISHTFSKLFSFVSVDLSNSFSTNTIISHSYYILFIASFIYLFIVYRKEIFSFMRYYFSSKKFNHLNPITFLFVFFFVFFVSFSFSDFSLSILYGLKSFYFFWPIYPGIFIFIALFLYDLYNKKGFFKILSLSLIFIIVILGLFSIFFLLDFSSNKTNNYRPYCYDLLGESFGQKYPDFISLNVCEKINDSFSKNLCFYGFGRGLLIRSDDVVSQVAVCKSLDSEYSKYCILGFGSFLPYKGDVNINILNCDNLNENDKNICYRGFSSSMVFVSGLNKTVDFCNSLNDVVTKSSCYDGISQTLGRWYNSHYVYTVDFCDSLDNEFTDRCYRTFGVGLRIYYNFKPDYGVNFCNGFLNYSTDCLSGFYGDILS